MADQGQSADLLWSSDITLALLGPVRLGNSAGDDFTPRARKTRALLAILALAKGPVTRSRLTELLWGDRGEEQAKASLRQALYELRDLASGGYLTADRESVTLGPKKLSSDVSTLRRCMEDGDAVGLADTLQEIDCPLLATLDDITPELDEWLRDERSRIIGAIVGKSADLADEAIRRGDAETARRVVDQLERLDPLDERVAQLGIRADIAAGDRSAASRRHARFSQRLKEQLGFDVSPDTDALLRECTHVAPAAPEGVRIASADSDPPFRKWNLIAIAVALALLIAGGIGYVWLRSPAGAATPTVAVLPFDDLEHKQGYFANGVSDEILNLLAHQGRIRVLGRFTAEQVGERPDSLAVARKLGITHLLDGSVRSAGNRVLVIVRLTRVSDGAQLWSERYDRRIGDIFAVQGDIASAVAAHLTRSLVPAVAQATSPDVYDRYLAARQLTRERREVTLKLADKLLREAIARDPHYAPAFAELAQVIMLESDHPTAYGSIPVQQARAEAEPFARRAVQLDPNLGDGYAAIGFLSLNLDARSEPYFRKAVELSPQRPEFHRWHAETLLAGERYEEAIVEYRQAVEIDPLWGLNYDHLMGALFMVGRDDEARKVVRRFFSLSSDQRAKQLLNLSLQKIDQNIAGELNTARWLDRTYPNERQNRLNLASTLAQLGERQAAANAIPDDRIGTAVLKGDWQGLANASAALGPQFWDQAGFWNAAGLLVASGHSAELARFYQRDRATIGNGVIDLHDVAMPQTIVALRNAGDMAEANRMFGAYRAYVERLPGEGILGDEKSFGEATLAALGGDRDAAIRKLDDWTRRKPLQATRIPAMALRYEPGFTWLSNDPRFLAIEDRLRVAINSERSKVGLPPISHEAWISDPKTLLTKN